MKCPYRIITTFTRPEMRASDSYGNQHEVIASCTEMQAHTKTQDFMDCLKRECGCYQIGNNGGNPRCVKGE